MNTVIFQTGLGKIHHLKILFLAGSRIYCEKATGIIVWQHVPPNRNTSMFVCRRKNKNTFTKSLNGILHTFFLLWKSMVPINCLV